MDTFQSYGHLSAKENEVKNVWEEINITHTFSKKTLK